MQNGVSECMLTWTTKNNNIKLQNFLNLKKKKDLIWALLFILQGYQTCVQNCAYVCKCRVYSFYQILNSMWCPPKRVTKQPLKGPHHTRSEYLRNIVRLYSSEEVCGEEMLSTKLWRKTQCHYHNAHCLFQDSYI